MTDSNETPAVEEEKRPFQFSLRTIFVVTFVWAVVCAIGVTFGLGWALLVSGMACCCGGICLWLRNKKELGVQIVGLGMATALLALVVSILVPEHGLMPNAVKQVGCIKRLKFIGLALSQYEDVHGCLPPAYIADESGKPMHSWRVLILPYLCEDKVYQKYNFDEPWDGPNNRRLHDMIPVYYHCPADTSGRETDTSYAVVVGPNTMFPGEESVTLSDATDGSRATAVVVEVKNSGIHWMEPRDLHVVQMAPTVDPSAGQGISSGHPGVVHFLFGDAMIRSLDEEQLTPEIIQAILSRDGGEEVDFEDDW